MVVSAKYLLLCLFAAYISTSLGANGLCNTYERLVLNEGKRRCRYLDTKHIPTVGIGFNLRRGDARSRIRAVGANYDAVLHGTQCLNDQQIRRLFDQDMREAEQCASSWLRNWNNLGRYPQSALADMAFNLGCSRLRKFRRLHAALSHNPPNYQEAVREMRDSRWCRQVKSRCDRNVHCMQRGNGWFYKYMYLFFDQ